MATVKKSTSSTKARQYDAFRFLQRGNAGPTLVLFYAPVGEIKAFAEVEQLGPRVRGPQREQKEARVQAISKFLVADNYNTIPTALILAFSKGNAFFAPGSSKNIGILKIRAGAGYAATIVDGQHRLFGIDAFDPTMNVPVVALLEADKVEQAFQFLVINNKSSKVPVKHIKALLAKMKRTSLSKRLLGAKMAFDVEGINDVDLVNSDQDSPFLQTIDWSTTPKAKRIIQATAIELSLDYLGGIGVPEFDDRDVRRSVFLVMWRAIKANWTHLWQKDSRLISKVGIICLTRFIIDHITSWADSDELDIEVTDLGQIEEQTRKIIKYMDPNFWTAEWAEKAQGGFDTNQGRDRVLTAITQLFRNGRRNLPWYTDIEIIQKTSSN